MITEATVGQLLSARASESLRRLCEATSPVPLSEEWVDTKLFDQMSECGMITLTQRRDESWTAHPTILGAMVNELWRNLIAQQLGRL